MRIVIAVTALMLLLAAPARAVEIPVTTLGESTGPMSCSLRAAIAAANTDAVVDGCTAGSGADIVRLDSGTYTLSTGPAGEEVNAGGDLDVTGGTLTIAGTGAATTSISAAGDRVLDVVAGTVTLSGVTVTGTAPLGEPGGGIRNAGTLTLVDAAVTGSHAGAGSDGTLGAAAGSGGAGGGIFSSGPLTLLRTTVSDNVAGTGGAGYDDTTGVNGHDAGQGGPGGGIFATGAITIDHSRILRNDAGAGGPGGDGSIGGGGGNGGSGGGLGTAGMLTMTSSLVAGNAAGSGGVGGDADSGQGGHGGDGGDGGGLGSGVPAAVGFSTFTGNVVGPRGVGGASVQPASSIPGVAGAGSDVAAAAQTTLARTIAAGTCLGAVADGGANLGGAGCPGSHAAPRLTATGVPDLFSPAIDGAPVAGCPATDVAGIPRPQGVACDIGAFEARAGMLAFNPPSLTFTATKVGGVRRYSVTVTNTGFAGLALPKPIAVAGAPHFALGPTTCGATVLGGRPCAVTVDFTPKSAGTRTGTLTIGTRTFALSGTGFQCVVPKLKGKTIKQARKLLRKAHCTLGKVVRRGDGRPGRIRSTKPKAGAKRPAGTRVNVVVNRRRAQ